MALGAHELTPTLVDQTLGALLKYQEDVAPGARQQRPAGAAGAAQRGPA